MLGKEGLRMRSVQDWMEEWEEGLSMNGKRIEQSEIDFISVNYLDMTDEQMSEALNRSKYTIINLRQKHKLLRFDSPVSFTNEDRTFIRRNHLIMSDIEIGRHLNRSHRSISGFRYRNKIGATKRCTDHLVNKKVREMRELIEFCENSDNTYKIGLAKEKLKFLSGL